MFIRICCYMCRKKFQRLGNYYSFFVCLDCVTKAYVFFFCDFAIVGVSRIGKKTLESSHGRMRAGMLLPVSNGPYENRQVYLYYPTLE